MSITVLLTNDNTLVTLLDKVSDTTTTSLTLFGYGFPRWGEALMRNMVHMLENAANTTPPPNPLTGQLWFNSNNDMLTLWDGTAWEALATQDWASAQIAQLQNAVDFLTYGSDFATNTGVQQQIAAFIEGEAYLTAGDLANYVTGAELTAAINALPSVSLVNYATIAYVQQNYLTANQTITVLGDASGSGSNLITLTLVASGVTAGTYSKLTVNAKGLVTAASQLGATDINTALGYTAVKSVNGVLADTTGNVTTTGGGGTVTLTGDVTGSGSGTIATTLSATGVATGTYTKVNVNPEGRITLGTTLNSGDVTNALGYVPVQPTRAAVANALGYYPVYTVNGLGVTSTTDLNVSVTTGLVYSGLYVISGSTSTYFFTVPAGCTFVKATITGAGGGGGSGVNSYAGGGGGAGGTAIVTFSVTPGDVLTMVIGAGGTYSALGGVAQTGGTSTLSINDTAGNSGVIATATGGGGGSSIGSNGTNFGGAGGYGYNPALGSGITGSINTPGGCGSEAFAYYEGSGWISLGGLGGASWWGGGGRSGTSGGIGGFAWGSGGGGGYFQTAGSVGGVGQSGCIMLEWNQL